MGEAINFVFFVDVSGSMYGQKIASVNASVSECISELKQLETSTDKTIRVTIVTFAEKLSANPLNKAPSEISIPNMGVVLQPDGFYSTTSYNELYRGIRFLLIKNYIADQKKGESTYMFLFSDAKPVDSKEYDQAYNALQGMEFFKNSHRYFANVNDNLDIMTTDILKFVDYNGKQVIPAAEASQVISKLSVELSSDSFGQGDNDKYSDIFK